MIIALPNKPPGLVTSTIHWVILDIITKYQPPNVRDLEDYNKYHNSYSEIRAMRILEVADYERLDDEGNKD